MAIFSDIALEKDLNEALVLLDEAVEVELDGCTLSANHNFSELPDLEISGSTPLCLTFPYSEGISLSVNDFITLAREVTSKSTSFDGLVYCSESLAIISIEPANTKAHSFVEQLSSNTFNVQIELTSPYDGVKVGLITESLAFAASVVVKEFYFDKYLPPITGHELFVAISHSGTVNSDKAIEIVYAYLFELSSSLQLQFVLSTHPLESIWPPNENELEESNLSRLRPLMIGPGLGVLLRDFHRGNVSNEPETAIIEYVKCLEYISTTVVRERQYDDLRKRLMSPSALNPTAAFMDSLMTLCEKNRIFKKDHEALQLTVEKCCDANELLPFAPKFLVSRFPTTDRKQNEINPLLTEFAATLSATRNQLSHSKANYEPTGKECPTDQLSILAECARVATEQCIRWYAAQNPDLRRVSS